jgi:hypothetical protein
MFFNMAIVVGPVYLNNISQASQFEMVIELREFLRDYLKTCFYTNFYLELNGKRLNDFSEFKDFSNSAKDYKT